MPLFSTMVTVQGHDSFSRDLKSVRRPRYTSQDCEADRTDEGEDTGGGYDRFMFGKGGHEDLCPSFCGGVEERRRNSR